MQIGVVERVDVVDGEPGADVGGVDGVGAGNEVQIAHGERERGRVRVLVEALARVARHVRETRRVHADEARERLVRADAHELTTLRCGRQTSAAAQRGRLLRRDVERGDGDGRVAMVLIAVVVDVDVAVRLLLIAKLERQVDEELVGAQALAVLLTQLVERLVG